MLDRLTKRIAQTTAVTAGMIGVLNYTHLITISHWDPLLATTHSAVWGLALVSGFFWANLYLPNRLVQVFQALLFLLLSGPVVIDGTFDFFGMWFFLLSVALMYKYRFFNRFAILKLILVGAYFVPWLVLGVLRKDGPTSSFLSIANYSIFLFSCTAHLFFIFEEEIRDLLASNKSKDVEIAEKQAEIARLEPLSVLGERVAHVAHSFKNNLSVVGTALYYLENNEPEKAAKKMSEFAHSMNERIDNILMVSRAGAEQPAEVFDAARLLSGLNQVYLTEPVFLQHAKVEIDAPEPTPVLAVRWDFLLMAENILKNALEALTTKGGYGNIRVTLKDRLFTLSNDGGAIALCSSCQGECLNCPRYGRPGQTNKSGGTGHGLAQVFATCRKYGWTLRIRSYSEWTAFEIGLTSSSSSFKPS